MRQTFRCRRVFMKGNACAFRECSLCGLVLCLGSGDDCKDIQLHPAIEPCSAFRWLIFMAFCKIKQLIYEKKKVNKYNDDDI